MFTKSSLADLQLRAATNALKHFAETCNVPVTVRLWDGSEHPLGDLSAGGTAASKLTLVIRAPGVIGALLRRPTLDNLVRQYAVGGIEFVGGDLIEFGEAFRAARKKLKLRNFSKSRLFKSALPFLFARGEKVADQHGFQGDNNEVARTRDVMTSTFDFTMTSATSSISCS